MVRFELDLAYVDPSNTTYTSQAGNDMIMLGQSGVNLDIVNHSKANIVTVTESSGDITALSGNLIDDALGKGLQVKEGSNAKQGTATLVAGTVTVSDTAVTANSRILLTAQSLGTVTVAESAGGDGADGRDFVHDHECGQQSTRARWRMRFLSRRPEWPRLCLSLVVLALTACQGATTTSAVPAAPVAPRATVCVAYDEAGDIAFSATTEADATPALLDRDGGRRRDLHGPDAGATGGVMAMTRGQEQDLAEIILRTRRWAFRDALPEIMKMVRRIVAEGRESVTGARTR